MEPQQGVSCIGPFHVEGQSEHGEEVVQVDTIASGRAMKIGCWAGTFCRNSTAAPALAVHGMQPASFRSSVLDLAEANPSGCIGLIWVLRRSSWLQAPIAQGRPTQR